MGQEPVLPHSRLLDQQGADGSGAGAQRLDGAVVLFGSLAPSLPGVSLSAALEGLLMPGVQRYSLGELVDGLLKFAFAEQDGPPGGHALGCRGRARLRESPGPHRRFFSWFGRWFRPVVFLGKCRFGNGLFGLGSSYRVGIYEVGIYGAFVNGQRLLRFVRLGWRFSWCIMLRVLNRPLRSCRGLALTLVHLGSQDSVGVFRGVIGGKVPPALRAEILARSMWASATSATIGPGAGVQGGRLDKKHQEENGYYTQNRQPKTGPRNPENESRSTPNPWITTPCHCQTGSPESNKRNQKDEEKLGCF